MLAAQSYQESLLDQNARSPVGAIGLMQVMPATGTELGVGDITIASPTSMRARSTWISSWTGTSRTPGSTRRTVRSSPSRPTTRARPTWRECAGGRGARPQPEKWFNNVEIITAEKIGIETTTYVRNIYKYYVSYKLMLDIQEAQKKAREAVKQGG